ncbi:uncharacterized protein LOC123505591 isoform X2 [Portunus trituberculatus]|uniref:uncharacterized protein LOC123505591 isoform X2 n=1 Tax=Portunus trituberculatus TaxID=210409 RepID=UPI001E1D0E23|nr:uncharacterized protein LOC123505591 isoform X2 [Portunus trituberculatus]
MVAVQNESKMPQRHSMNIPRSVLNAFSDLVKNGEKTRTAAAMLILQHVEEVLRRNEQPEEMPEGVKYIINRLVAGLASSHLMAREGYFSALCYLLRLNSSYFSPQFVFSLLADKKSATMKSVTKDENRDQLLGELLLCGAVVRSGRAVDQEVLQQVVNMLCAMRAKKSYLDITASQFLVNLIESYEGNSVHPVVWGSLQAELKGPMDDLSPSQVWIRLVLLRKHRVSPPVWLTSTLAPKNHEALVQTLMKTANDLPKVHPVVEELVTNLAAARTSSSLLTKFLQVILEPLQGSTSPAKLQIIFQLLRYIVPHLRTPSELMGVVTPSVMALLLNSLTQHTQDLRDAARGVTGALVQLVKDSRQEDGELQLAVVSVLVTPPGSVRFDQLTGHKVLAVMVPHFTLNTLKGFTKILLEEMNKPVKNLEVANRNYAAHTIGNLLTQPVAYTPEAATWKKQQLMSLLKAVVFTPRKEEGDTSKDAFFSVLGKQVGYIREYSKIVLSLVEEIDQEMKVLETAGSSSCLSDDGKEQWALVISRLATLKGKECTEGTETEIAKIVFQVLYCQMALHLFVDVTVAKESITEFITCHRDIRKLGMLKGDDDEDDDNDNDNEAEEEERPNWVEVLTEMLLSLLTQEMHLFRSVVQGLFWLLTPHMTATALSLLTDVLDTEEARHLVKKDTEDDDGEQDDDDDKDDGDGEEDKDENDDDEEESEAEEEEIDEEDADLFTLKQKMFDVAGGIDVDVDMDSVPQEELDRLDDRLGALLSEYRGKHPIRKKNRKKGGGGSDGPQLSAEEQSLMHFQTRVCDMLIVYIKAGSNMALYLGLVNPIFKALSTADLDSRQKDLQNKLITVTITMGKKRKFNTFGEISVDAWKETMNEFFSFAFQIPKRFLFVIQSCYAQLMHCGRLLLGMDEEAVKQPDNFLTTTYVTHLETLFTKTHHFPKRMPFSEPCTYNMGGLWRVVATLVRFAFDPEMKVHKQARGLKMLEQLYHNKMLIEERKKPEAAAVEQDLYSKALEALGSEKVSGMLVSAIFKLLHTVLQTDGRMEPQSSLAWEELHENLEAFRKCISKSKLKFFRKEYNVLNEALRRFLSKKDGKKKGVKRGAGVGNEGGKQQRNQRKKRKVENENNINKFCPFSAGGKSKENEKKLSEDIAVVKDKENTPIQHDTSKVKEGNNESNPKKAGKKGVNRGGVGNEGGKQQENQMKKKKNENEKKPSEDSTIVKDNEGILVQHDTTKVEEGNNESNSPQKVIVNGDDSNTLDQGQGNIKKKVLKKKKKGVKRVAGVGNEGGKQQQNQMRKKKDENINNNSSPLSAEKAKENENEGTLVQHDTNKVEEGDNESSSPQKVIVNGDDSNTLDQGQGNIKKKVLKKKKKGVKRVAGVGNEGGKQQGNQMKKKKEENENINNSSPLSAEEKAKKNENTKKLSEDSTIVKDNEGTPVQHDTNKVEEGNNESSSPQKVIVNGDDSNTLDQGQENVKKITLTSIKDNKGVINMKQVGKNRKKKSNSKLTGTPTIIKNASKISIVGNNAGVKKGKKKINKIAKRKQEKIEKETATVGIKAQQITSSTLTSPVTPKPTPKKRKIA